MIGSEDPRIRPPYQPNTAEIALLKAILAELVRLRQLLEDEVEVFVEVKDE